MTFDTTPQSRSSGETALVPEHVHRAQSEGWFRQPLEAALEIRGKHAIDTVTVTDKRVVLLDHGCGVSNDSRDELGPVS